MKLLRWLKRWLLEKEEDSVFFLQGHDVLPQPLDKEAEEEALIAWENGDEEARNRLIEHNLRLVVYIAKRYETNPIFMEDLISIGSIGLIKAVNTFRRDKNIKLVQAGLRSKLSAIMEIQKCDEAEAQKELERIAEEGQITGQDIDWTAGDADGAGEEEDEPEEETDDGGDPPEEPEPGDKGRDEE